jgi:hypothetical protein
MLGRGNTPEAPRESYSVEAVLEFGQAKAMPVQEDLLKFEHIHVDAVVFHRLRFGRLYARSPMKVSEMSTKCYKLSIASPKPARVAANFRRLKLWPSPLSKSIVVLMCSKIPMTMLPAIPGSASAHANGE